MLICNYLVDVTKEFNFYYVSLMFTVNMHGFSDGYSKYAWVIRVRVKKGGTITKAFQEI